MRPTTNNRGGNASRGRSKVVLTLRQRALRALARRDYSRVELARKLSRLREETDDLDALLDEFEASGWLSDERFAGTTARAREGRFSQRHIVEDLKSKGVSADTAKTAVDALGQDDEAIALALWRQRFGRAPADQKEKARQVRFLQSRGFSLSVAFRVLKQAGTPVDDEGASDD